MNSDNAQILGVSSQCRCNLYTYCNNNPINDSDAYGNIGWSTILNVLSYIFDFFVSVAKTAASMSKQVSDVIKAIKNAKSKGASKDWIKLLKKKKKTLVTPKALGIGKINAIATLLGLFVAIVPYLSYLKKMANGVFFLAEFVIDITIDILKFVGKGLVSLICKFIPFAGFVLGWALGIVVDLVMDKVFNSRRINAIKRTYANKVKSSTNWKKWIESLVPSIQTCF